AGCVRCRVCPGYICPTGARYSSARLLERPEPNAPRVLTNVEAEQLVVNDAGQADGVRAVDRASGRRVLYRARRYVLAAGAIGSPLLLLRSHMTHPLIGRNYMMHYSPVVIGIFAQPQHADEGFIKQVGFCDYYFGTRDWPHKMGLVQSLPVPGPLLLKKAAPPWLPRTLLNGRGGGLLPLVGIIEDLPNPENHVCWGGNGRPRLRHRFARYDLARGKELARVVARILKRAGAAFCLTSQFGSQ